MRGHFSGVPSDRRIYRFASVSVLSDASVGDHDDEECGLLRFTNAEACTPEIERDGTFIDDEFDVGSGEVEVERPSGCADSGVEGPETNIIWDGECVVEEMSDLPHEIGVGDRPHEHVVDL